MSSTAVARIYGLETEFGLTCVGQRMSADDVARRLFAPVYATHQASNIFLTNGSRLYLDVGAHPEYATAECSDLVQLLTHDRAGEVRMAQLAAQATQVLAEEGSAGRLAMFKNNTDSHGNSYGCHENYLVRRVEDFPALTEALLSFLVSRQLICGAGKVRVDERGRATFAVSQRADHMLEAVSSATTRSRPMINTRDEPHADPRRFRRLHVIVGDSTMSEPTTLLKVGSMELVLRLLEQHGPKLADSMLIADPTSAIRAISSDVTGRMLVELRDGRQVSGLDLQEFWYERAQAVENDDPVLRSVLRLWRQTLDAVASDNIDAIATRIDWAIKKRLVERFVSRHGVSLASPEVANLDLAYHEITGKGVFRLMEARGQAERITTDAAVTDALGNPPPTTRAALRGKFIQAAEEHGRAYQVDWVQLQCQDLTDGTVLCPDPLGCVDERVDSLCERMATQPKTGLGFQFS